MIFKIAMWSFFLKLSGISHCIYPYRLQVLVNYSCFGFLMTGGKSNLGISLWSRFTHYSVNTSGNKALLTVMFHRM